MIVTRSRKLALTVALFAAGAGLVLLAGAVHNVGPLFVAWIPLLTVPWLLTRGEPRDPRRPESTPRPEAGQTTAEDS